MLYVGHLIIADGHNIKKPVLKIHFTPLYCFTKLVKKNWFHSLLHTFDRHAQTVSGGSMGGDLLV